MLQWNRGRNLIKYNEVSFAYNAGGIRQEKTANTVVHKYHLEGTRIHKETYGNNTLWYYYDQTGVTGLEYNGSKYYFQKNIQNDVVRIFDQYGMLVASYEYDAWGNHKVLNANGFETTEASFIGNINPFRYRGYYYDAETGLYYLNSRYYDPRIGRFISSAEVSSLNPTSINGLNLYSYANNNSIGIVYGGSGNGRTAGQIGAFVRETIVSSNIIESFTSNTTSSIHWKNEWFATGLPSFLVFSPKKVALLDWGLSIYKVSLYFDEAENHSLYIAAGNVSVFAGYNVEKDKLGVFADINALTVGYDGRYIDAGISVAGVGFIFGWENKRFRFKIDPPGFLGFDISIDIGQIIKDIFGWDW